MTVIIDFIKQILAIPFSYILSFFYGLTNNYILAIIFLTVLVKCCFLPNAIKQQKSMAKTTIFNKKIKLIKEKYANEPEKQENCLKALKTQEPDKKMNIGCLPTIVQFIVMIGLLGVIYTPLTNVLHIEDNIISEIKVVMSEAIEENNESMPEIILMKETENYKEELLEREILTEEQIEEIITFKKNYNFFGINLSGNPQLSNFDELWLIPFMVFIAGTLLPLSEFIKRKIQYPNGPKFAAIEALPFISPMMMFVFAFMFSAGVGLYWAISNLLTFIQVIILNRIYQNPKKMTVSIEDIESAIAQSPVPITETTE